MSIGSLIFSLFCLFALIASVVLIASASANAPAYSDTYGNNLSSVDSAANGTQGLTSSMTTTGTGAIVPILLVSSVVVICGVCFVFYEVNRRH
jgi:hypothetical protein